MNSSKQSPIFYQETPWPDAETLDALHPFVREWFEKKFKQLSPPQQFSVLNIKRGMNTLISSPTGSGKTLSAFLAVIDNLITLADKGQLQEHVYAIYISPLKALANDIEKNLNTPLKEIQELAKRYGRDIDVRVGVRSGDTTSSQKQAMLKKPPHIMITTPESLAISLASIKFSLMLSKADAVIIDEIHSLADSKRGTQLSLCLEQLEDARVSDMRGSPLVRIGLSATVRPLEDVAQFLVGMQDPQKMVFRPCRIVDVQFLKQLDLKVLSPVSDLVNTTHEHLQKKLYQLLHDLIQEHKTTLIFTNTRSGTERVVHNLKDIFPRNYVGIFDEKKKKNADDDVANETQDEKKKEQFEEDERGYIGAHHGSLSKQHRLNIENRLKNGELKAVVCSTSLELGIDIGYVDLVILLGSPKSVARALQRIGRSGHKLHETAKGRIIVMDRDDLVECSILLKSAIEKKIDSIHVPKNALDVLSQMIYGFAIDKQRHIEELFLLVRKSFPYSTLSREVFMSVIYYLSGNYVELEKRYVYGKIWYDEKTQMIGKRGKLARLLFMTNVGTIPDETNIKVKLGETIIGTITEGFLERLKPGDVFVLGGEAYEFHYSRGLVASVKTSGGRLPTVPSWISEMLPLSFELACDISLFRKYMADLFETKKSSGEIKAFIDKYLYVDAHARDALYNYFYEQYNYSIIPHSRRIVIEHFSEGNTKYVIFHTLYGRRTNDVLARALAYAHARVTKRDVAIGISDNGFYLKSTHAIPARRLWSLIKPHELQKLMVVALDKTEVLRMRFRHCAARSLMILRSYKGQSKSVGKQQMSSRLLLQTIKEIDDEFPILQEARREVLEDLMDIHKARLVLEQNIPLEEVFHDVPSPFAFDMVLDSYTDLLRIEDRVEFLKRMHLLVLEKIANKGKKVHFEKPAVEFSYENLWNEQHAMERKKQENYIEYLHELFRRAARKVGLETNLIYDGHLLIDGREKEVRQEFYAWLKELLSGTVPKIWHDDLVKFFQEKLRDF